jgi:hypothetical protein
MWLQLLEVLTRLWVKLINNWCCHINTRMNSSFYFKSDGYILDGLTNPEIEIGV